MKRKFLIPIFLLAIFTFPAQAVYEESDEPVERGKPKLENFQQKKEELQEKREMRQEIKNEKRAKICENVEERIEKRLNRFEENRGHHLTKYNQLMEKLNTIVDSLSEKDFDTSKLEEDLVTLDEKVQAYAEAYKSFITALGGTQGFACGESDGSYKDALEDAKAKHMEAKALRLEIREFYQTVIREDIKDLREQAAEMKDSVENSENE